MTAVQTVSAQAHDASLRDLAKQRGIRIGTAVNVDALADDSQYASVVGDQFNSVTAENVMKWETVEPSPGTFDFAPADTLVRYAARHHQEVRGHTLLWHNQLPGWLTDGVADGSITADDLRDILHRHITAEVSHFKGKIYQWDVVNEVLNEDGTLRDSIWSQKLGDSFIADAFRWAHQADPHAKLFLNDYNIESKGAKSDAYYDLVKRLRAQGVPIDGVGFQGHLDIQYDFPSDLADNMARFDALGLATSVTEADVRIPLPADEADLTRQASDYSGMLAACLATEHCTSFTVWGFTDAYSWVPGTFEGEGAANLYDESYQPKPAYTAVADTLAKQRPGHGHHGGHRH
nr:endo-1,4-beta-xylanase [Streptomyces sp. ODS25]